MANFGDVISPLLIEKIFGMNCILAGPSDCDVVAAGSIVEAILAMKKNNRPALWGTGFMFDADLCISSRDFNIIALRGQRSAGRVQEPAPKVTLGDPGLLANYLLESTPKKTALLGIVPHYVDAAAPEINQLQDRRNVKVIDILGNPHKIIEQIAECECVLSSSLHGLIAADSLAVPNAHIKLSDKVIGNGYKFLDYYSSFGNPERYSRFDTGLLEGSSPNSIADRIMDAYKTPIGIETMRRSLIRSFPF